MKTSSLQARIVDVGDLLPGQLSRMYEILEKYYANISFETFIRDLSGKSEVILLLSRDFVTNEISEIQGFSTLKFFEFEVNERRERAVFSGDTIIEQDYWGQTTLQRAFVGRLVREKLKAPNRALHWYLISKGYKTYLLMANNFVNYYPRPDGSTLLREETEACSRTLFGPAFNAETGLLDFGPVAPRLRGQIAPICDELRELYPKIDTFVRRNPTWSRGTELACIAVLDLPMLLQFSMKTILKILGIHRPAKAPRTQPRPAELPVPGSLR